MAATMLLIQRWLNIGKQVLVLLGFKNHLSTVPRIYNISIIFEVLSHKVCNAFTQWGASVYNHSQQVLSGDVSSIDRSIS